MDKQQVMDNRAESVASSSSFPIRQVMSVLFGILAIVSITIAGIHFVDRADPYARDVLSLHGDARRGTEIFLMNCATCHGAYGKGEVGPSLQNVSSRKSKVGLIRQVVSGRTPPMPQFQPTPQDMADLLKFLETL
ncbi:cytochrome c [Leptolyngbya sp. PL-A3]|uniref:c-type cytochrome n=1 Tax=Leptolyngbya sp. FACHB-8 TaxID=2692814 RepID=UPI001F555F76|nr:cytochrome c [Leptolyngbya sp. FACHB-8]